MAPMTSVTGMRSNATTCPPARSMAAANGAAHVFSYMMMAAAAPGFRIAPTVSKSSWVRTSVLHPVTRSHTPPSASRSSTDRLTKLPSSLALMATASMIRMVPLATRSSRIGRPSPENLASANSMTT